MTDLLLVLPGFATQAYTHLIPSLEKNLVTTTDLLTLDAVDIAKRAKLPLPDVKKLCAEVLQELRGSLGLGEVIDGGEDRSPTRTTLRRTGEDLVKAWQTISTLDSTIDKALGGGIPTGYITEIAGESGAGKTQFLLGLLLATQLPPPHGLSKAALYISTESGLPTTRLSQMLRAHPILSSADPKPSLDRVISIVTPDLESQDHILRYQVPVAIQRHNIGVVVIDSVAANYRAEFERPGASKNGENMAKRSSELIKLGQLLRDLARTENIAVVVANQVADRFTSPSDIHQLMHSLPSTQNAKPNLLASRSSNTVSAPSIVHNFPATPPPQPARTTTTTPFSTTSHTNPTSTPLTLDHQQRWFTGWGDDPYITDLKTPSLGLVWTSQIACRVTLLKSPLHSYTPNASQAKGAGNAVNGGSGVNASGTGVGSTAMGEGNERNLKMWRRWVKVVFAPWAAPSGLSDAVTSATGAAGVGDGGASHGGGAVEFRISASGITAVDR